MEQLFSYLLQSALVLTVLFIPFQLLLRKEHFYALNRAILLGIMVMSLTLPLSRHTLPHCLEAWWHPQTESTQRGAIVVEDLQIVSAETLAEEPSWLQEHWMQLIVCLWALGTLVFFCWQMRSLVRLYRILHSKEMVREPLSDGNTLFLSTTPLPSFSWMKSIVMSSDDYEENGNTILTHERAHIAHHHSFDKLLLMVVECIQWWNPFVWLMADALSQVHEYEADLAVLHQGINATQYQLLLIRKAAGPAGLALVNGFKHNKLKLRIVMMNNKNHPRGAKSRYLALIPMMLLAIACTARAEESISITVGNEVELLVNELGQILMSANGEDRLVKIEELGAIGKEHKTSTILITANRETPMAVIREIREVLRQEGIQKIVYKLPEAMGVEENMDSTFKGLFLVDGKVMSKEEVQNLQPNIVQSMEVLKDEASISKYIGQYPEAKDGVIIITTKKE